MPRQYPPTRIFPAPRTWGPGREGRLLLLHRLSLGLVLCILWLLLSGYFFSALLLGLGLASAAAVVFIAHRMDVIDHEGHPVHLGWRAIIYLPWLLGEIVKANIDVARRIIQPSMPIRPNLLRVKASQKSELGNVIYANSITLTPGTVTVELDDGLLGVHAITAEAAEEVLSGEMDRRVTAMEGHVETAGKKVE